MKTFARLALALLFVVTIAACGGGDNAVYDDDGNLVTPATTPEPDGPYCRFPNGNNPQLLYPANGTTGVPDSLTQVVIADVSAAPYANGAYGLVAVRTNSRQEYEAGNYGGSAVDFGALATYSGAVPVPNTPTTFNNAAYLGATSTPANFDSQQHYYVYIYQTNSTCNANGPIGSFTTQ